MASAANYENGYNSVKLFELQGDSQPMLQGLYIVQGIYFQ